MTMNRRTFLSIGLFVVLLIQMVACSSIDCPFMNTVYTTYQLKQGEEQADTLRDTLSVWIHRFDATDSVVLNKAVNVTSFNLPMSYTNPEDSLFFCIVHKGSKESQVFSMILDTVVVRKTNIPHFESVDCSPKYFHEITDVNYTHNGINLIEIKNTSVTYEPKNHFYIYFKH